MSTKQTSQERYVFSLSTVSVLVLLAVLSRYNYPLFHSVAEIFSITVAFSIFIFAYFSRRYAENDYFMFLGVAYLFVGGLDLVHTLSYPGMGVLDSENGNIPTQLWIAARYLEGIALLVSFTFLKRKINFPLTVGFFGLVVATVLASIFKWRIFPDCFVEGEGLTLFKQSSEFFIAAILGLAIYRLINASNRYDPSVFALLAASIGLTVAAELFFTFYISAYGLSNLVGHLLKVVSFYLVLRAIIHTGLRNPYRMMFRELVTKDRELRRAHEELTRLFEERTRELQQSTEKLEEDKTKLEKRLLQQQKMEAIGRLARGIAHDFNNLLNVVMVNAELALDDVKDNAETALIIQNIQNAGARAKKVVEQLVSFSRGQRQPVAPVDISKITRDTVRLLRSSLPLSLRVKVTAEDGPLIIMADATQIHQVVMNLVTNAADAMNGLPGVVDVELKCATIAAASPRPTPHLDTGDYVILSVTDTGHGISPENIGRIFDPYFTTKSKSKGTGLGLSVVHGIVKSSGGDIVVDSAVGRGTRFDLYFKAVTTRAPQTDSTAVTA